jgi:hypothetical protein
MFQSVPGQLLYSVNNEPGYIRYVRIRHPVSDRRLIYYEERVVMSVRAGEYVIHG